ncbi:hypothetical protein OROHE_005620 [Orobanche hederae]
MEDEICLVDLVASGSDSDQSESGGDGTSAGSNYSASRNVGTGGADSDYRGGRGAGRGGAGRGTGRQRNGKNWRVIGVPTSFTGTLPQIHEEDVNGGSIHGEDNSIPLVPHTASENELVYLKPEFHSDGRYLLKMRNNYGFIYGGAPDPARWLRTKFYDTNFKEMYKSWYMVYSCPAQSDGVFFEAFKVMISLRYKDIINKMKKKWIEKKIRPVCMIGKVWTDWLAWWDSPEFKKLSNKNKRNRESENGEACVHTGGSVSLINLLDGMKKFHGEHVDEMDALIAMHTRKGPGGQLIWRQYKDIVRERAITEGIIDPNDASNTRVPFEAKDWDAAIVADSQGKRIGRGNKLFGFGNGGRPLLNLPTSRTHASSICQATAQDSSKSIRELKLESEMDDLKETVKQLKEQQEKERQDRDLEQQEHERQNQWLMQLLMNPQQQRVPWSSQQQQQNQWAPSLVMGASGTFQQQPQQQNQWPLAMFSPQQQLLQLQQQSLQQPHSGHSSSLPDSYGRGSCGNEGGGGSGIFAGRVENTSLLEMLTDPNYGRGGNASQAV